MWLNWRNYCLQFSKCWIVSDLHHFQLISAAPHFCSLFTKFSFTCRHTHLFTCLTSKHLQVLNYYFYFNSWLKLRWLFSPESCFKLKSSAADFESIFSLPIVSKFRSYPLISFFSHWGPHLEQILKLHEGRSLYFLFSSLLSLLLVDVAHGRILGSGYNNILKISQKNSATCPEFLRSLPSSWQ